jgi:sugar phosphate isomerase/epimerase
MKLGVFSVSMPEYEPMAAMEKLAKLGYDGIEWRVIDDRGDRTKPSFWSGNRTSLSARQIPDEGDAIVAKARALGLEMPSLGAYIDSTDLDDVELHFRAAVKLGAKSVRVSPGAYDRKGPRYRDQMRTARERYARVAEIAKQHDVRALIETHMGLLTPTVVAARAVLEGLDPAAVGIMWDPANQVTEGLETYEMALDCAGEYLAEVHIKNQRHVVVGREDGRALWKVEFCPLEEGFVDWPAVIAELRRIGYEGWLMFEDFSTAVPIDARLEQNLAFIRAILERSAPGA